MNLRIRRWGKALAVRIPSRIAHSLGWKEGTPVQVSCDGERLIVRQQKVFELNTLLSQITPDTLHSEVDWGPPLGREIT